MLEKEGFEAGGGGRKSDAARCLALQTPFYHIQRTTTITMKRINNGRKKPDVKEMRKAVTSMKAHMKLVPFKKFPKVETTNGGKAAICIASVLAAMLGYKNTIQTHVEKEMSGFLSHIICDIVNSFAKKCTSEEGISITHVVSGVKEGLRKLGMDDKNDIYLDDAVEEILHVASKTEVNITIYDKVVDIEDIGTSVLSIREVANIFDTVGKMEYTRQNTTSISLGDLIRDFWFLSEEQMLRMEIDGIILGLLTRTQGREMKTSPSTNIIVIVIASDKSSK